MLLHLVEGTDEFPRRARILRNLIEASSDELRLDRMPKILQDVHHVIRDGNVDPVAVLNQAQVEDEKLKTAFLEHNDDLAAAVFGLEDHDLLHGSLGAFDLDPATFENRATEFDRLMATSELWPDLLARSSPSANTNDSVPTHARSYSARTPSITTAPGGIC